jgi:8-oxo-dGTP diphosphatase
MNPSIRFFDPASEFQPIYTYAIIVSRYRGKFVWVRHRDRLTWELPAGHLEPGESPDQAAHRELFEETGALEYLLCRIVAYEGIYLGDPVFGMLFLAELSELGPLPDFDIGEIGFYDGMPDKLTYPDIQPLFFSYIKQIIPD